jgi:hypothetical protein
MGEPFLLRPWEIGRLTPYQTYRLYSHPRDEHGQIKFEPCAAEAELTEEETFFRRHGRWGLPPWRIRQKWREWVRRNGDGS